MRVGSAVILEAKGPWVKPDFFTLSLDSVPGFEIK